ncbi:MAG: carbonic anhydrase [Alphaproteobacteria bacterium]|nr:carbonic anhydrase [Alphaproteobacteria bacterium]
MGVQADLIDRNRDFAATFARADLPNLPKLRTLLVTCIDARVDPAHVFGLDLGEAVVIRNNGGRVTRTVIEEIAILALLVSAATGGQEAEFNIVLVQHTQCGVQRLASPEMRGLVKNKLGLDVSEYVITDHVRDLHGDIEKLARAPEIPDALVVSAMLYDVGNGSVQEVAAEKSVGQLRAEGADISTLGLAQS